MASTSGLSRWLGRLRSLPAEVADLERRCITAEDEVRFWRGKSEIWEQEAIKAHEEKDRSHRCFVDWCSMRISGFPVFGGNPPLPREALPSDKAPPRPMGKRLAREVVNEMSANYNQSPEPTQ